MILVVETRGPAHCEEVIFALRAAGYTLAFTLRHRLTAAGYTFVLARVSPTARIFPDLYALL